MANQFLIKETMTAMRSLSAAEITALQNGTYEGVQLLGYYEKGDIPAPIIYYLAPTTPDPGADDGGSVIETNGIKLVHPFNGCINVSYFGIHPNSGADITIPLQQVFDKSNSGKGIFVVFENGEYIIDPTYNNNSGIFIKSNTTIECKAGTKFVAKAVFSDKYSLFTIENAKNVRANVLNIIGDLGSHLGVVGEHGMGLSIKYSSDIVIDDLYVSKCWGDGLYIGQSFLNKNTNENLIFKNINIADCRRQGLTVITANGLFIDNMVIGNISGKLPAACVDIEPNFSYQVLKNININNLKTYGNSTYSFLIALANYTRDSDPISINLGNMNLNDRFAMGVKASVDNFSRGIINIDNMIFTDNRADGLRLDNYYDGPDININKLVFINTNRSNTTMVEGACLRIINTREQVFEREPSVIIGDLRFLFTIPMDSWGMMISGNNGQTRKNVRIKGAIDYIGVPENRRGTLQADDLLAIGGSKRLFKSINSNTLIAPYNYFDYIDNASDATGTLEVFLEKSLSNTLVSKIVCASSSSAIKVRFPSSGGVFEGMPSTLNSYLQSNVLGSYIVVVCVDHENNIWRVAEMFGQWSDANGVLYQQPTMQIP
ncbi:hypothetical protein [Sphingobacterium sp. HMA12]|uniref:hypothetical protein n=1 Tax=Sphingobacterium sp. HMA12 TaxID=2050894 RepID=UPI000CEA2A29|nr:hypothetical protein [Sphingobacterium sp. HMA12]